MRVLLFLASALTACAFVQPANHAAPKTPQTGAAVVTTPVMATETETETSSALALAFGASVGYAAAAVARSKVLRQAEGQPAVARTPVAYPIFTFRCRKSEYQKYPQNATSNPSNCFVKCMTVVLSFILNASLTSTSNEAFLDHFKPFGLKSNFLLDVHCRQVAGCPCLGGAHGLLPRCHQLHAVHPALRQGVKGRGWWKGQPYSTMRTDKTNLR